MTEPPRWRFLDQFQPDWPPESILPLPAAVRDAVADEHARSDRLGRAVSDLADARAALEAAGQHDANAEVTAAGQEQRPPKPTRPQALAKVEQLERLVEALRAAVKDGRRNVLDELWSVRQQWAPRVAEERERQRQDLLEQVSRIGAQFDKLAIHDEALAGLEQRGSPGAWRTRERQHGRRPPSGAGSDAKR